MGTQNVHGEKIKNEKSLDDLRAILKKLAVPKVAERPGESADSMRKVAEGIGRDSEKRADDFLEKKEAVVTPAPVVTLKQTVSTQPATKSLQSIESMVSPQAVEREDINILSPKKLERMMRVTGGDKSPLT